MTLDRVMLQQAVGLVAPSVRSAMLDDAVFAKEAGYRTSSTITFEDLPFDVSSLARSVARLYRTGAAVNIHVENGQDVKLELDVQDKRVVCVAAKRRLKLPRLSLFASDSGVRLQGMSDIPEFGGLLLGERDRWVAELSKAPMTSAGFIRLLQALKATPVAHALRFAAPGNRPIRLDEFAPAEAVLMRRAVGSYSKKDSAFVAPLRARQKDWLSRGETILLELALSTVARSDMGLDIPSDDEPAVTLGERVAQAAPRLDPFGRVAAIEHLVAAASQFPALAGAAKSAVETHLEGLPRLEDDLKIFSGAFLLAQAQLSVGETREASWRHRRTFAWMLASSATRGLSGRTPASDFFQWAYTELGHRYRIAVALDKHVAPRWNWSDGDPGQLKSEVLGRLFIASRRFPEVADQIGLTAALETDRQKAEEDNSLPFWFMPAPLEGQMPSRKNEHRARQDIEHASLKRLALDDPSQAFAGAGNIAKLRIPRPALVAGTANRLQRVTADQMVDEEGHLQPYVPTLVHFAGVASSAPIAGRIIELLIDLSTDADARLMNEIVHNVLECAATPSPGRSPETIFVEAMRRVTSASRGGGRATSPG